MILKWLGRGDSQLSCSNIARPRTLNLCPVSNYLTVILFIPIWIFFVFFLLPSLQFYATLILQQFLLSIFLFFFFVSYNMPAIQRSMLRHLTPPPPLINLHSFKKKLSNITIFFTAIKKKKKSTYPTWQKYLWWKLLHIDNMMHVCNLYDRLTYAEASEMVQKCEKFYLFTLK